MAGGKLVTMETTKSKILSQCMPLVKGPKAANIALNVIKVMAKLLRYCQN